MHLSLKGFLRTPETHHEAHQSTTSAVPQTAENNLSSPPGKIHHPCPNHQRWHTALLLLRGNQRAGAQQSPPAHYTFYRADPPEGCRLCEDASSGDHAPGKCHSSSATQVTSREGSCEPSSVRQPLQLSQTPHLCRWARPLLTLQGTLQGDSIKRGTSLPRHKGAWRSGSGTLPADVSHGWMVQRPPTTTRQQSWG
ncbi:hypothetical protein J6590_046837 [Homalodisca vitripennis]|nr:hypothetical protein J6590_046837 [Homalodisca vitripennis]